MVLIEDLKNWIEQSRLPVSFINDRVFELEGKEGQFLILEDKYVLVGKDNAYDSFLDEDEFKTCDLKNKRATLFNPDFTILLNEEEESLLNEDIKFFVYKFGERWYYSDIEICQAPTQLNEFKYLGKAKLTLDDVDFPYIGIHGGYDLFNGSREYKDWCKKAKFLGIKTLGICEENTLAGTLAFQSTCEKAGIKSIIGQTITVQNEVRGKYNIKLYVLSDKGWINLLKISSIINVKNNGEYIDEVELFSQELTDIACVLTPDADLEKVFQYYKRWFSKLYFQIDFVEWASQSRDESWLMALKNYFEDTKNEYQKRMPPILICDSYYLDKEDHIIRKTLNNIGRVGFKGQSKDQYFKSLDEIYEQAIPLFKEEDDRWQGIIQAALENVQKFCEEINFKIPTAWFRLPEYELTEEQKKKYANKEELFWAQVEEGLQKKVIDKGIDPEEYIERIDKEMEVITQGGFISYFLILWDLINWCSQNDIWVGTGRGSAAGCLISYLLDIVKLDPIQYNLLFERFLNKGRIGKSLPDIDTDFQGGRRDEVKRYLEERYGLDYVTSIGTYSTFKVKGAVKDLAREQGVDYQKTNYVSAIISSDSTLSDLFKAANEILPLREYVQKNWHVIEKLPLVINQPKNSSIHAAGVVIVPKEYGPIYQQMPIKSIDGVLVSEWEGEFVDKAGFLKCDILGIKQLDKFAAISDLIKSTTGKKILFEDIDLNEPGVYYYFQEGYNEDVFQFGAAGLKVYCKELKPEGIEDLIATVALYRPGPIENGIHKKYIYVKNGFEALKYDKGTESITKVTYGQIIYQEQIMQIFTHVAGFSLVEADDVRKAISKTTISRAERLQMLKDYMDQWNEQGKKRGYSQEALDLLWEKIEKFATYSFNRSHAACYAVTGYYCQWFKYKYPLQFWTVSLQFADESEMINRISEIKKTSDIEVAPVDINKSKMGFYPDTEKRTIYWSINSVKWVGEKAVQAILDERNEKGAFFSIEEFCERISGRSVNKRCIVNLILAGAFDEIERVKPHQRLRLLEKYFNFTGAKLPDEYEEMKKWKEYQWVLKQKELTGFGFIDYKRIINSSKSFSQKANLFKDNMEILHSDSLTGKKVIVAGIIINVIERKSKNGPFAQVEIQDNTDTVYVTIWNDDYEPIKKELKEATNKIFIISGVVKVDSYKNCNVIQSTRDTKIEII